MIEPTQDFIRAPWDFEQVDALNRFQRLGYVHEFTCPEHHDGANRALFATREGWRCPHCDYRQDWAHKQMLTAVPIEKLVTLPCDVMLAPATIIRKGCGFDVLMTALKARDASPMLNEYRFNDPAVTKRVTDAVTEHVTGRENESPIRDLTRKLDAVAQAHIAYPQVAPAMGHLRDHLSALARCEEVNQLDAGDAPPAVYRR